MEYNEDLLQGAFVGFSKEKYNEKNPLYNDWENISIDINNIFTYGINPMAKMLGIEIQSKIINVHYIGQELFIYNNFLNACSESYKYSSDIDSCKLDAKILMTENHTEDPEYLQKYYNDYAVSIGEDILINSTIYNEQFGLHLVVHEIMHSLSNSDTVIKLRKRNEMGDEAINEFFARLVTLIYRKGGGDSAGFTTFDEIKGALYYDDKIGCYGKLLKSESYLSNLKYKDCEHIKKLGAYYFEGKNME